MAHVPKSTTFYDLEGSFYMWFSYCNCFIVFYRILAYFIMYFTA